jgi:endonuclease YncB( thermonuclease family)
MRVRGRLCVLVLSVAMLMLAAWGFTTHVSAQASDPVIGTWTLNVAKSTFSPGPGSTSATVTFEAAGQSVHVVADIVDAKGVTQHTEYTGNYDGKDYPITGVAGVDTVSLKRIDATSTQRIDKKAGKVVQTWDRKVSADGKTLTVTQKGTDAEGRTVNNVMTFEKK